MGRSRETFGKKEVKNKQLKKRKDKEQRKQNKKGEGKKSLDDMIAYVDENGMITSTPPDLSNKTEIDPETIELGATKRDPNDDASFNKGTITKYNDSKGYGFISVSNSSESIFFHINDCLDDIKVGNQVEFDTEKGLNGLKATNVKISK